MAERPAGRKPPRKTKFRCEMGSTVLEVLRDRGYIQVDTDDTSWDLCWCDVTRIHRTLETLDNCRRDVSKRVCHYRNHYELTRKNLLARNLMRLRRKYQREGREELAAQCDIMPLTFELPAEYLLFVEEHRKRPGEIWIVKPASGSQGRGIFLFRRLREIREWRKNREDGVERPDSAGSGSQPPAGAASHAGGAQQAAGGGSAHQQAADTAGQQQQGNASPPKASFWAGTHVVQLYLQKPYLIAGRKFDLRIYVLVTSFYPLKVWVAREGFARMASREFSLENLSDKLTHLTNTYLRLRNNPRDTYGSKWPLQDLRQWLAAHHGHAAVMRLVHSVAQLVLTSLTAVQSSVAQDPRCFELYGYDVLLDADLRPWLLEVNACPSLYPTDSEDHRLKYDMLQDVFNILDFEGRLTGKERRVGGWDLLCDGEPLWAPVPGDGCGDAQRTYYNIFLGCMNDREEQLQTIWREASAAKAAASTK